MYKKTKIIATISDNRCDVEFIRSLYDAGMNAVRINSAHAPIEGAEKIVDNVRKVSDQIAVMIDTKGPEIRLTGMAEEYRRGFAVEAGNIIGFMGTDQDLASGPSMVYMNNPSIFDDVPTGALILIDDGELELEVIEKRDRTLFCKANSCGTIKPRKSVNIPGVPIDLPSVTQRDKQYIEWAARKGVDFIAHSFVRHREDVLAVKEIIDSMDSPMKIIAKIENREGVNNLDEILKETYGVMVARGDLGVEIPAEQIPVTQRHIVKKCVENKSPVIIATQMLHSMISNPRPTRAEVSDIASAIYQRVDAIMLSGETANGDYPVEAVTTMARVAREIENDKVNNAPDADLNIVGINNEITAQLARSAVKATLNLPAKAIVIDTMSGRTGRYLSAFRGDKPVYAICYRESVMRQLAISYGIHALYRDPAESIDRFPSSILFYLERRKWLNKEDLVVVVGGSFGDAAGATFMEISTVLNLERKHSHGA